MTQKVSFKLEIGGKSKKDIASEIRSPKANSRIHMQRMAYGEKYSKVKGLQTDDIQTDEILKRRNIRKLIFLTFLGEKAQLSTRNEKGTMNQ